MSTASLLAIRKGTTYLQSPLDDLYSFFWTAVWATLFNPKGARSTDEILWREDMRGTYSVRDAIATEMRDKAIVASAEHSRIVTDMLPIFGDWWIALDAMRVEWLKFAVHAPTAENESSRFYLPQFNTFAHRGVVKFAQIVHKHQHHLQKYVA